MNRVIDFIRIGSGRAASCLRRRLVVAGMAMALGVGLAGVVRAEVVEASGSNLAEQLGAAGLPSFATAPIAAEDADFRAVEEGYISVTPLHLDLTNYELMEEIRRWDLGL